MTNRVIDKVAWRDSFPAGHPHLDRIWMTPVCWSIASTVEAAVRYSLSLHVRWNQQGLLPVRLITQGDLRLLRNRLTGAWRG